MSENEYRPGSMDIREQEKVYENFIKISVRFAIATVVFLVLLAIVNG